MPSNYPGGLDNLNEATNPGLTHRNVAEAIEAIQSALGINLKNINPIGGVQAFAGSTAPANWVLCDGAAISRTTYADLFAVIGTTYGSGNGSTTFNVPNTKGRVIVARDAAQTEFDVLGETGGAKTHMLSISELPAHSHGGATGGGTVSFARVVNVAGTIFGEGNHTVGRGSGGYQDYYGAVMSPDHTHTIASEGGGEAHNNLQPYITMNYIIYAGV